MSKPWQKLLNRALPDDSKPYLPVSIEDATTAGYTLKVNADGSINVGGAAQAAATDTLQDRVTANANGAVASVAGYSDLALLIQNGAGTCTVTVQGSLDSAFASGQDALTLGVVKATDSTAGTVVNRVLASGAIAVAANTSYLYVLADVLPYIRAVVSAANALGAGTSDTGCSVKLYRLPI